MTTAFQAISGVANACESFQTCSPAGSQLNNSSEHSRTPVASSFSMFVTPWSRARWMRQELWLNWEWST